MTRARTCNVHRLFTPRYYHTRENFSVGAATKTSGVPSGLFEIAAQLVQFEWKKLRAHEPDVIRIYMLSAALWGTMFSHIFPTFN